MPNFFDFSDRQHHRLPVHPDREALYLRVNSNINPIAIGRGKRGFRFLFEFYAFAGL
jgi:hypothetical protein